MKQIIKKITSLVLLLALFFSVPTINIKAYAADNTDETPTIEGIAPYSPFKIEGSRNLELSQTDKDMIISPYAGGTRVYKYVTVTSKYDGYRDRGDITKGRNDTAELDILSFNIERYVNHTYNIESSFSRSDVEAKVGYNLSWGETRSWTYTSEVAPYKVKYIGYMDWYHTSVLKFSTETVTTLGNGTTTTKWDYSDGWADEWYMPEFYSHY